MSTQEASTTQLLVREFEARARNAGLVIDCMSDGSANSEIAVVAEAPGATERANKRPLTGGSGRMFWTMLRKYAGIERVDCYVTNVFKRQVNFSQKGGTDNKIPASSGEGAIWRELLLWELSQLPNLRLIIGLGNESLIALSPEKGIMSWHGSLLNTRVGEREIDSIFSYNPAFVIREPKYEAAFALDMQKVKFAREGRFVVPSIETLINPSPREAIQWIEKLHDEAIVRGGNKEHDHSGSGLPISFDIETLSGETACIGLSNRDDIGLCINFVGTTGSRYSLREELRVRRAVQSLLGDREVRLVAQNGNFDSYWLWYKDRIRPFEVWFDTMLAHHCIYPQLPHDLGFLTAQYTFHPYYKDEGKEWRDYGDLDSFWRYNVKDVCITRYVQKRLLRELTNEKLDHFFFDLVMPLQRHLVLMTTTGLLCDVEYKDQLARELEREVDQLYEMFQHACRVATGEPNLTVSPNSPVQMAKLLFDKLGLVGRGRSTDEENRKRMLEHPRTTPEAREVLEFHNKYKKEDKFLSTYARMRVDPDGRIRCEYKQTGVMSAPGRLSSSKVMWGSGMNLQNQPERAYKMFLADPGYAFTYFDLSQAEARVVGWLAKIGLWIEQFERARLEGNYDCHRALAAEMFGVPYDEVPTYDRDETGAPTSRFIAKRCRHGLNYRMGPDRLSTVTGLGRADALRAYNLYHRINPELKAWWADLEREARTRRVLFNPFGRRLKISGRIDDSSLEAIVAYKPQSTVGDRVAQVIRRSHEDREWPKLSSGELRARCCLNIHDALVAIHPDRDDFRETVTHVMKKHAEEPILINGRELIIPAEFKYSVPGEDGLHRWSTIGGVH